MKPERAQMLTQGLIAGLIGYATVALFYVIANLFMGESPFYTAAILGEAVFYGLRDPSEVVIWPGAVIAYNGLHLLVFLVLGTVAAWLAFLSERGPQFWYLGLTLFIFILFHVYGAALMLTESIRAVIPAWMVVLATLLAAMNMGAYLVWVHPRLRLRLREPEE